MLLQNKENTFQGQSYHISQIPYHNPSSSLQQSKPKKKKFKSNQLKQFIIITQMKSQAAQMYDEALLRNQFWNLFFFKCSF